MQSLKRSLKYTNGEQMVKYPLNYQLAPLLSVHRPGQTGYPGTLGRPFVRLLPIGVVVHLRDDQP